MERPKEFEGADSKIKEYIENLEERLAKFDSSDTLAKFYVSIKKQVDDISVLLNTLNITEEDLKEKDEKFFDRYLSYLVKSDTIAKNLLSIEKMVDPVKLEKAQKKLDADSADKFIFNETQQEV